MAIIKRGKRTLEWSYPCSKSSEDGPLPPELYSRKMDANFELHELLVNEEIFWLQQSNERWLLKGDLNTAFYHRVANGKKRKNTIQSLTDGEVVIEGTTNLLAHATAYYKELFGPARGNLFHLSPDMWADNEKLTEDDNILLTSKFMEEEVKKALFNMKSNRAPGPDSIPAEFYKHCWEFVKQDITRMFDAFHTHL